mgnify:CR=1 FL=1
MIFPEKKRTTLERTTVEGFDTLRLSPRLGDLDLIATDALDHNYAVRQGEDFKLLLPPEIPGVKPFEPYGRVSRVFSGTHAPYSAFEMKRLVVRVLALFKCPVIQRNDGVIEAADDRCCYIAEEPDDVVYTLFSGDGMAYVFDDFFPRSFEGVASIVCTLIDGEVL